MKASRLKVELFTAGTVRSLGQSVNDFLIKNPNVEIRDILFTSDESFLTVLLVIDVGEKE